MRARSVAAALILMASGGCSSDTQPTPRDGGADAGWDAGNPDRPALPDPGRDAEATDAPLRLCDGPCPTGTWATWPMPNPGSTPLPNPASFTVTGETAVETVTGLEWQRTSSPTKLTYAQGMTLCQDLVMGGKDDWRLPTRIELIALVDFTRRPTVDPTAFPDTPEDYFWSQTPTAWDPTLAWSAYFGLGLSAYGAVDGSSGYVRCVRGGKVLSGTRYELTASTVKDLNTGLVWMRRPLSEPLTWEGATDVCASAQLNGVGGWRLPSQKEIQTLVDETRSSPAVDPEIFPNTPVGRFWTSSPVNKPNVAESVYWDSTDGAIEEASNSMAYWVRCVK